jgi:hypothetical protein
MASCNADFDRCIIRLQIPDRPRAESAEKARMEYAGGPGVSMQT